jgi:hypothetical protein
MVTPAARTLLAALALNEAPAGSASTSAVRGIRSLVAVVVCGVLVGRHYSEGVVSPYSCCCDAVRCDAAVWTWH